MYSNLLDLSCVVIAFIFSLLLYLCRMIGRTRLKQLSVMIHLDHYALHICNCRRMNHGISRAWAFVGYPPDSVTVVVVSCIILLGSSYIL